MRLNWFFSLTAVLLLSAGSYAVYLVMQPPGMPAGFIYGNGHIEGTEIRISSEVGGRLTAFHPEEGDDVAAGQVMANIEPDISRDRLEALQGELDALQATKKSVRSQVELWEHHAETARRQVERVQTLLKSSSASKHDLDQSENTLREAKTRIQSLRDRLAALEAQMESAGARVKIAATQLSKTEITAPVDGTLIVRAAEPGEVITPGQPVGLLVNLDSLELKIYVPDRMLGKLVLNDPARVRIDAFPDRYFQARIKHIDDYAQFTPRDIHLPEERIRMVYGVVLALDNPGHYLKPGMPADAWIRWDKTRAWPEHLSVPTR